MTWTSDSNIISGLPTLSGLHGTPEVWDNNTKFLSCDSNGNVYGYSWNGSTWNIDASVKSGINGTINAEFTVFENSGVFKCIQGDNYGNWYGYTWGGSSWSSDSSVINGLISAGTSGNYYKPCVFNDSGTLKLIYGHKNGLFYGFYWNGSTWISDSSIVNGLPDIGYYSNPEIYNNNSVWNLIAGQGYAGPRGFYWTGSTWTEDSSIVDGLSSVNAFGSFTVFGTNNINLIAGRYQNTFLGFITLTYVISGTVTKGDGSALSGVTIRVTNTTNDEYADDVSDANGAYSVDLANLTSTYSDGDGVKVRCYSTYKTTTVDLTNFATGRTVNLTCFGRFQIDDVDITGIISNKVSKTIGQAAWNSETLLENKNGYRSTNYQSFQPLQIDIDGVTLLKGRIRDVDLNTNHLLKISGENYSSLLNDAYITDQQAAGSTFSNKSIYYAITDSSDGIIPNYASSVTTTNVANDVNTQQTFTKTFNKESISSALMWLGELASSIGYIFYVDNNKDLHFEERRTIDTELTLVNTGSRKCVMGWEWRNSSGKDIYNRIRVIGSGVDVTRNDISSQTEFGIREHPTITDNNITIVADANTVGDNLLSRYANPFKEVVLKCKTNADVADSIFPLLFTSYFGGYKGLLYLEPGDLIRTDISGIGIPQSNIFPWTFSTDFTPEKRIVLSIEHQFPQYITTLKLSEYYKDLSTLIASNVKGEIK